MRLFFAWLHGRFAWAGQKISFFAEKRAYFSGKDDGAVKNVEKTWKSQGKQKLCKFWTGGTGTGKMRLQVRGEYGYYSYNDWKIKIIWMWKTMWKMWITPRRRKLHIILCKVDVKRRNKNIWNKQENNFRFCQKIIKKNRRFFRLTLCEPQKSRETVWLEIARNCANIQSVIYRYRAHTLSAVWKVCGKRVLTLGGKCGIIGSGWNVHAGVAQLVEQLIRNQ